MARVKIGVQLQPQHADIDGMRRAWREADELGVDSIFNWDHFFPLYGDPDGKHYEALATLAAMAENTERAQIGSLVICNSYRNPEYLAYAHATIDHLSRGRVILGIGAGWFERDYEEFGYEFGDAPYRLRELRHALPRIKERLGKVNPPPIGPMPILIGGSGPKVTLKLVAQHAQMWHSFGDVEGFRTKDAILREHCEAVGRDHTEIERTWGYHRGLDPQLCEDLAAEGVDHFIVGVGGDGSGYDLGHVRELLQWRDGRGDG
jgi:probable F420-dependent oxidoreductase